MERNKHINIVVGKTIPDETGISNYVVAEVSNDGKIIPGSEVYPRDSASAGKLVNGRINGHRVIDIQVVNSPEELIYQNPGEEGIKPQILDLNPLSDEDRSDFWYGYNKRKLF